MGWYYTCCDCGSHRHTEHNPTTDCRLCQKCYYEVELSNLISSKNDPTPDDYLGVAGSVGKMFREACGGALLKQSRK